MTNPAPNPKPVADKDEGTTVPPDRKSKRSLDAKFGAQVASHGFTTVPNLLLEMQAKLEVSPTEFNLLIHLVQHWWEADKAPFPKIETLARRLGKSERMVLRYLDGLEKAGLIKREHRYRGKKQQTASAYHLTGLVAKLLALEPEMKKAKVHRDKRVKTAETASSKE